MKVTKWVDFGQEVEVDIDIGDIRAAVAEAFGNVTADRLGEERPNNHDVARALNSTALFLNALTDEHIELLTMEQKATTWAFLLRAAGRFAPPPEGVE